MPIDEREILGFGVLEDCAPRHGRVGRDGKIGPVVGPEDGAV